MMRRDINDPSEFHPRGGLKRHNEHGQDWVTCLCGATWSVVTCEDYKGEWEDYEQIDDGEEGFHGD